MRLLKNPAAMSARDTNGQWLPIQIAPDDCDLELGRPHKTGIVPWTFPARRRSGVWFNVWANEPVLISPSHWRIWRSGR
ncbi:hypothetical protein AB7M17_006843 [Bradyrhizobium sp. USDA 377]